MAKVVADHEADGHQAEDKHPDDDYRARPTGPLSHASVFLVHSARREGRAGTTVYPSPLPRLLPRPGYTGGSGTSGESDTLWAAAVARWRLPPPPGWSESRPLAASGAGPAPTQPAPATARPGLRDGPPAPAKPGSWVLEPGRRTVRILARFRPIGHNLSNRQEYVGCPVGISGGVGVGRSDARTADLDTTPARQLGAVPRLLITREIVYTSTKLRADTPASVTPACRRTPTWSTGAPPAWCRASQNLA